MVQIHQNPIILKTLSLNVLKSTIDHTVQRFGFLHKMFTDPKKEGHKCKITSLEKGTVTRPKLQTIPNATIVQPESRVIEHPHSSGANTSDAARPVRTAVAAFVYVLPH